MLMEIADSMVSSGLRDAGYKYINLDDGWAIGRYPNGTFMHDPDLFPHGIKPVADYIHSKGMLFGIYTARGSQTCMGRPGSDSHEELDAQTFASWGVDYLKEDSCGGTTHGTVWDQYAKMRDALNKTGRQIWYSITQMVDYDDRRDVMHCSSGHAFTTLPWVEEGRDPTKLANSYLVEYCNNKDFFGSTGGEGGFLSQLDSQQLLTWDNLTVPGAFSDNDMLENCNGGQTVAEYRSQLSTFAILTSPLILGNDPRNMTASCLEVITNKEIIALSQDKVVSRAKLVYQWPESVWPPAATAVNITLQAWAKPLADGSIGAVIFNRGTSSMNFNLTWSMIGLDAGVKVTVRDLWKHKELGPFANFFACENIGPHDVVALRFSPLGESLSILV